MTEAQSVKASQLSGLGIDILSLSRARHFIRAEGREQRLNKILTQRERRRVRGRQAAAIFAKLFTAKESYFKTLNRAWLGVEGFRSIEITLKNSRFSASLKQNGRLIHPAEGRFILGRGWVAAEAVRWN